MKTETALERTRDQIAALDERKSALVLRRNDLVVKLRLRDEPVPTRAVAELAGISNPRVTQLENEARERSEAIS